MWSRTIRNRYGHPKQLVRKEEYSKVSKTFRIEEDRCTSSNLLF